MTYLIMKNFQKITTWWTSSHALYLRLKDGEIFTKFLKNIQDSIQR